MKTHLKKNL